MRRTTWIAVLTTLTLLAAGGCGGDAGTDPGGGGDIPATDEGSADTPEPADPGAPPADATDPGPGDPGMPPDDAADPGSADPGTEDPGVQDPGMPPDDVADPGPADPGTEDASDPGSSDPGEPQADFQILVFQDDKGNVPVAGVTVTLLSQEDGAPLGPSAVTDDAGEATIPVPGDRPFILRLSQTDSMDTYHFGLRASEQQVRLELIPASIVAEIQEMLSISQDPAKGIVLGQVLFRPDLDPAESIGCATVSSTPTGQVFYSDEDGPATTATRASTGRELPEFLAFNLPAGAIDFEARVGDEVVATGTGRAFPGGITLSVVVTSYAASNPTPIDCTL